MSNSSFFDAYYFEHGCGRPYERNEGWLNFFDGIAKRIIEESEPKTVLDAGCALGFLVEAFRNRGVEAFGIDISKFAIENVYPDIKPYCWVGSVCEPFPQKYDLNTCIEILEHLTQPDAEKAIANICAHANEIVFSSTPFDYKESTHFNVQPPEYWAEQFARYGFYRDLESDMSFITSWSVKFVKINRSNPRLVREYERKFWYLWKENTDLRSLSAEMRQDLSEQADQVRILRQQTEEKEQSVQALTAQLTEILISKAWKFTLFLRQIRVKLLPPGSRRERLARWAYLALKIWRREGLITLMRKIKEHLVGKTGIPFSDYQKWIHKNEPRADQLAEQRVKVNDFDYKPLISVVVPVWNTPAKILNQTIRSVVDQTYDKWELCIADGNSNPKTKKVLSYWTKKDGRIKIKFLDENKGIAVNSNEALSLAQGEFVAFLDHDDLLAPFALFEVVLALQQYPNADLVYSDEDLISVDSKKRFGPHFKPAYNPDLLRSINYITHLMVIRKTLGDKIGWLKNGYEGAQDYDLTLRAVERAREIAHIPKVLYHWRHWTSSTTNTSNASSVAKKHANESGKKALKEHLERCGLNGVVEDGPDLTTYQVRYGIIDPPLVSIIILNRDHSQDLRKCITSIRSKSTYENYEIIVVENASRAEQTFNLYDGLKKDPFIRIIEYKEPFNFARANNFAVGPALGDVILFLNNDTEVISRDWLERMLEHTLRREVGIVGSKLYYPGNTIQHGGVILGIGGFAGHSHKHSPGNATGYINRLRLIQNYSAVTGACLMIRKDVFYEIGGFDEQYDLALSDIDLCLKALSNNYLIVWTPYAELYHYESKTRGYEDDEEKQRRLKREIDQFKQKWSGFLQKGDPYYNPNLTLSAENFSINPKPVNVSVRIKPGFTVGQDGLK